MNLNGSAAAAHLVNETRFFPSVALLLSAIDVIRTSRAATPFHDIPRYIPHLNFPSIRFDSNEASERTVVKLDVSRNKPRRRNSRSGNHPAPELHSPRAPINPPWLQIAGVLVQGHSRFKVHAPSLVVTRDSSSLARTSFAARKPSRLCGSAGVSLRASPAMAHDAAMRCFGRDPSRYEFR